MLSFFKNLFQQNNENNENDQSVKYLIVGLGNIGDQYSGTRHNIGFEVVDYLAHQKDAPFKQAKLTYITNFKFKGRTFYMIKPTTYMNLSGKAVKYWMDYYKIKQENILVVVDDLALPFGKIRLKGKGSAGGHNGLKDIDAKLGNNQYARLRFGIGDNYSKGKQIDFVLGKWKGSERQELPDYIEKCSETILSFGTIGLQQTMSKFN